MNFFAQVRESIINDKFYRQIKNNKFGRSFVYMLVLFLIIYSLSSVQNYYIANNIITNTIYEINDALPDFKLENGEFSFNGKMPFYISNNEEEVIVIDTTGQMTEKVLDRTISGMLITKDSLYLRNIIQIQRFRFADINQVTITKESLVKDLPSFRKIILVVIAFSFVFAFGWKLLNAIILALYGMILVRVLGVNLKFENVLNFSIYALTFPMLLELAVKLSGYMFDYFTIVYWIISVLYMSKAIKACIDDNKSDITKQDN